MNYRHKVALFIALDLAVLLIILLFLAYYGMSHLLLLGMGLLFLVLTAYDLHSGIPSKLFSEFLGIDEPENIGRFKWLPVILSALLLMLSLPVLLEQGFVNDAQRWAMQHGQFARIAIPAVAGGVLVIAVAVWTIFAGSTKQ